MTTLLAVIAVIGASPSCARRLAAAPHAAPRVAAPAGYLSLGALAQRPLTNPVLNLAPSVIPAATPLALAPRAEADAGASAAAPALERAVSALRAPGADHGAVSARTFDAVSFSAPDDALPVSGGLGLRGPDARENRRIGAAVSLLSRTPVGRDVYAKAYADYGARLKVLVDEDARASYDARLRWQNGAPVLSLTQDLLSRGSDAVLAAFLTRELSHLYYKDFPDSAERSWMAHSVMVRAFAEITGSDRGWWDDANDLTRKGRGVMRSFYESWSDALARHREPRDGSYFRWLQTDSDSKSGPDASLSLRELHERGSLSRADYRRMDVYFTSLINSERRWLADRR